jgi:hypothetical protein
MALLVDPRGHTSGEHPASGSLGGTSRRREEWYRPATFMVRSAFVEPDSDLGAPSSLGL